MPTLMINGRDDFGTPVETNLQPMFDMLGTPPEHKRLVLLDGGHVPDSSNDVIREVLDWLDRYLGPVGKRPPLCVQFLGDGSGNHRCRVC